MTPRRLPDPICHVDDDPGPDHRNPCPLWIGISVRLRSESLSAIIGIRRVARELKSNQGRVNVDINGALSWPDREVVHLKAEKITSEAMIALFETLAARHPTATAINVVLDNASYNRSAAVRDYLASKSCRIQPVFLAPYSPNLNLIERVWWLLKKTARWNEFYPTFAGFKAAIDGFFRNLGSCRDQLTSLITDHFRLIGAPKSQPP